MLLWPFTIMQYKIKNNVNKKSIENIRHGIKYGRMYDIIIKRTSERSFRTPAII